MPTSREMVQSALKEYVAKNPPVVGGGRRTLIIPEPQPEDARDRYKTEGPVPDGFVRAEVCRSNIMDGEKLYRLGGFWATVKHQEQPNAMLERVFHGDVIDIPEKEFEILHGRNWVREPWKPKENVKKPPAA